MRKEKTSCETNPTLPFLMSFLITLEFPLYAGDEFLHCGVQG
jgi:hypothetical protein